jgi:hypothetical protein
MSGLVNEAPVIARSSQGEKTAVAAIASKVVAVSPSTLRARAPPAESPTSATCETPWRPNQRRRAAAASCATGNTCVTPYLNRIWRDLGANPARESASSAHEANRCRLGRTLSV